VQNLLIREPKENRANQRLFPNATCLQLPISLRKEICWSCFVWRGRASRPTVRATVTINEAPDAPL